MRTSSNSDLFLDKYRQLESVIKNEFQLSTADAISPVGFLMRQPEYRNIKSELDYCREVRNLLSHNPKHNNIYMIEPSDDLLALLDSTVQKIENPPRARNIAIPRNRVLCKTLDDFVFPTMREMNDHTYTHVPIVENDIVHGVFSENTILTYLVDGEIGFDETIKFKDIKDYLPIDAHKAESFRFIGVNTTIATITKIFESALDRVDRIGMLFVTSNGKPNEKLLGIITAWDVAGNS